MKLILLLILVGCVEKRNIYNVENECKFDIAQYEHNLVNPPLPSYDYSICEINLTAEQCPCNKIKKLPFNCLEVGLKIDRRIESREKAVKEWKDIIRAAKVKTKDDKETMTLLKKMMNDDKKELADLEKNRLEYLDTCKENK
jgi:hypothetical protein